MKGLKMFDAMANIDDSLIDDTYQNTNTVKTKDNGKRAIFYRAVAAAAVVAIAVAAVPVVNGILNKTPAVTVYPDAKFTAEQIGALFNDQAEYGVATNAYVKVYVPSAKELKYDCSPLPSGGTVGVYDIKTPSVSASEEGLRTFADKYYGKVCEQLGVTAQEYTVRRYQYEAPYYYASVFFGHTLVHISETAVSDSIGFGNNRGETMLGDLKISVDQTQDDEAMKASLEPIRKALCDLFEVDLRDIDITRYYDSYDNNGCEFLYVYFYNAQDNGVDFDIRSCSDYIMLDFDNCVNFADDIVSDKELVIVSVRYNHFRVSPEELCEKRTDAEMISLADAEQLLYHGYVFGGHSCPLCMEMQEKVDFEGYDHVGLTYVGGIPFYAFYKDIGISHSGNITYARTLVPAVRVSGYEEYFESQKANHRDPDYDNG